MKYEVPVCEMLKFNTEDVITTSFPEVDYVPGGTDTPTIDTNTDNGTGNEVGN